MINVAIIQDDISSQNDIKNFLSKYGKEKSKNLILHVLIDVR